MFHKLLKPVVFFIIIISFLFMVGGSLTVLASIQAPAAGPVVVAEPPQLPPAQADPDHGQYIFSLAGGCGCHNGQAGLLAGGTEYEGPFGVVYAANITPDPQTGIGNWSDQEIIDAIRLGQRPDGEMLFPIMPYPTLSGLADQDAQDLVAFMRTVPPVENELPERELQVSVPPFSPPSSPPDTAPQEGLARGEYIVQTAAHCGDCHTPRTPEGRLDSSLMLAGAYNAAENFLAPNITPDEQTGIGTWTQEDIATLLQTGQRPDGSQVAGVMNLVIEGGYQNMTEADAQAVASYLQSIPAVENVPQPVPQTQEATPPPQETEEVTAPSPEETPEAAPSPEEPPEEAPQTLPPAGGAYNPLSLLSSWLVLLGLFSSVLGLLLYRWQR